MLGGVGIGAGDQHAPLRVLGEGRPDLLPADHPFVAVLDRARLQRGEVGAGLGLGEALAPDLLAGQDRLQVALLLLLGAVGDHDRAAHRQAEHVGGARRLLAGRLADEDRLLDHRRAAAAVLLRPGDPGPAGLVQLVLPLAAEGHHLVETGLRARGRGGSPPARCEPRRGTPPPMATASGPSAAQHIGAGRAARPARAAGLSAVLCYLPQTLNPYSFASLLAFANGPPFLPSINAPVLLRLLRRPLRPRRRSLRLLPLHRLGAPSSPIFFRLRADRPAPPPSGSLLPAPPCVGFSLSMLFSLANFSAPSSIVFLPFLQIASPCLIEFRLGQRRCLRCRRLLRRWELLTPPQLPQPATRTASRERQRASR